MSAPSLRRLLGSSAPRLLGKSLFLASALLAGANSASAQNTWYVQAHSNGSPIVGPHGQSATISGILALPQLGAGDTIIVYENWFSESWSASGGTAAPPDGSNPLLTIYEEDITYPAFDITIKADPLYPGQGKVIQIKGTGTDSVVSFDSPSNDRDSVLDGFSITAGTGSQDPWLNDSFVLVGGGIKCLGATPTIQNCTVMRNAATLGGGIYASIGNANGTPPGSSASGPLILNCIVDSNWAQTNPLTAFVPEGGGIMSVNCSPEIDSTEVLWNSSAHNGGGIALWDLDIPGNPLTPIVRPIVRDSSIHDNTAAVRGGGFYVFQGVNPEIVRCLIRFNEAGGKGMGIGEGGGLFWASCQVELDTCVISSNKADIAGGGVFFESDGDIGVTEPSGVLPGSSLTHCTIDRNLTTDSGLTIGGGILGKQGLDQEFGTTRFENCLIVSNSADNGGGAHFTFVRVSFQNCTVSQNIARGTDVSHYVGGVYFNSQGASFAVFTLQDTILDGNRSTVAPPPVSPWDIDFQDASPFTPVPPATFAFCMMSTAAATVTSPTHPQFGAGSSNLAVAPIFAAGGIFTYFPNGRFYLAHMPQQVATSPGYNVGSQVVAGQLAINGMTCRTIGNIPDTGLVDLGFHYPYLNPLP